MAAAAPSPSSAQPRRRTTSLIPLLLVSLLLLSVVADHAAPLADGEARLRSQEQYRDVVYEEKQAAGDDEWCGGGAGAGGEGEDVEAECLMRRTLVAHTDYIYTQGGGHN